MANVPAALTFEIASHVLRKIFDRMRTQNGDRDTIYRTTYTTLRGLGGGNVDQYGRRVSNEVSLRTLLGLKQPSTQGGVTATFLDTFFRGMNQQQREAYFDDGAPNGFDIFKQQLEGTPKFRLQFTNSGEVLTLLELTARASNQDNPDLYHLSMFANPVHLRNERLHYNVHITQEVPPGQNGRHDYYSFDNLRQIVSQTLPPPPPPPPPPAAQDGRLGWRRQAPVQPPAAQAAPAAQDGVPEWRRGQQAQHGVPEWRRGRGGTRKRRTRKLRTRRRRRVLSRN